MIVDSECALCGEVSSPSLVIHQSFGVLPSVGAIAAGHVLLVPKRHVRRWLALSAEEIRQSDQLKQLLETRLRRRFGKDIHWFEHGSSASGAKTACSIEHAHLHALPFDGSVLSRLQQDYFWQPVVGWQQVQQRVGDREYLWYQAPDGSQGVCTEPEGFPSQYLRRVFAEQAGSTQWDWRRFSRSATMTQTILGMVSPEDN
jgi:diadenosine tetraphosphate (Ap4A) HIT family hydrolase